MVRAKLSWAKTNSSRARSTSSVLRRTLPTLDRQRLGAKDHVAEDVGPDVSRLSHAAECGSRQSRPNASCMAAICRAIILNVRSDDCDLPAGTTAVVFRGGRQTKQLPRLADFDGPFRNDFQLVLFGSYQSAVLSRRMVNSMAPSGSSRHVSTSLI